ncbi:MAG: arsenate reductase ArsC [Bacteroidales bacterium]
MEAFLIKDESNNCKKKFENKRILIICTGNSCRSQMAKGWLMSFDERFDIFSAGIKPEKLVNPYAVEVMKEVNIDISHEIPKPVDIFTNESFDYVITVCDNANNKCPVFEGNVKEYLHFGFKDPADAIGTPTEILEVYRIIRDEIRDVMYEFLSGKLK